MTENNLKPDVIRKARTRSDKIVSLLSSSFDFCVCVRVCFFPRSDFHVHDGQRQAGPTDRLPPDGAAQVGQQATAAPPLSRRGKLGKRHAAGAASKAPEIKAAN